MGYLQDASIKVSFMVLSIGVALVCAERITVGNTTCGGSINIDSVKMLHLNYYGAEIRTCLFNISSSHGNERELCIHLKLKKHQDPWDLSCIKSVKIFIGKYHGVYMPSRYTCYDLRPLCTGEKNVYVRFEYNRALQLMGKVVDVELDVYVRKIPVATTTQRLTTLAEEFEDSSSLSAIWIVAISAAAVVGVCFCGCVLYFYCHDEENDLSENANNQTDDYDPENFRMLQAPVVHPPPENTPGASGEPPDYYSVCHPGSTPDKEKAAHVLPFNPSGFEEERVIPSAPPPPYPGV